MKKLCLLFFIAGLFFTKSCASLSGFEEGRTLKEEQSSLQVNFNTMQVNEFTSSDDGIFDFEYFPNLEVGYKYGFSEKFDLGFKANTFGNVGINAKYQIVGDKRSPFAMSLGTEIYSFAFVGLFNAHIPLYMSYYPSEKLTFNIAPRYVIQFGSISDDVIRSIHYVGGNTGFMYGKKNKIGLDFGYHRLFNPDGDNIGMVNIGIGAKFVFGGEKVIQEVPTSSGRKRK